MRSLTSGGRVKSNEGTSEPAETRLSVDIVDSRVWWGGLGLSDRDGEERVVYKGGLK